MEDLIGVVIFVLFVGASIVGRLTKNQEKQGTPQWPGPVAGQPPRREVPRSAAPAPRAPQPQPRPKPAMAPTPTPPRPEYDPWRQGSLPDMDDPEGPEESERVDSGIGRFAQEREAMERREMEEIARFRKANEEFERSRFTELETGLVQSEDALAEPTAVETRNTELSSALANPASFARAVVLAEVLGKPKALRRGRRL